MQIDQETYSFGSAIVVTETPAEFPLYWCFENSWGREDGYRYEKATEIIKKHGKFYHVFFMEGYHPLNESYIMEDGSLKASSYSGNAVLIF